MIVIILQSCLKDSDNELTVVKGTVTNKITGEKVPDVPIEILKCANGLNFQGPMCDSLKSVFTDGDGSYETSFLTEEGYHYKIGIAKNEFYMGTSVAYDGMIISEGEVNSFDFAPIPFKMLQVHVKTNKDFKNYLNITYQTANDNENWISGTILFDTISANQIIDAIISVKIFPLTNYKITKTLCTRTGRQIQNYVYTDCQSTSLPIYVDYTDTTKIIVD